jgi:RNA polymerase sigma-70 factor, ECF subfamily
LKQPILDNSVGVTSGHAKKCVHGGSMRERADIEALKAALISAIPFLRALALALCGDRSRADDLVQETLEKAFASIGSFAEGGNLKAWLATILRNSYRTDYRKRRRETPDPDGAIAARIAVPDSQTSHMELRDSMEALQQLSLDQREALMMVLAAGMSYEEAAEISGCPVGTLKSRVSRARDRLVELLGMKAAESAEVEKPARRKTSGDRKKEKPRSRKGKPRKG